MPLTLGSAFNNNHTVNWARQLNTGRLAWWLANRRQFGGNVWYDLVSQYPATFSSTTGVNWSTTQRTGGVASIQVSGAANKYLSTSNPLLNWSGDLTIACWVNLANVSLQQVFVGAYQATTPFSGYGFEFFATNRVIRYWDGGAWRSSSTNALQFANIWKHIGVTVINTAVTFYVNGAAFGTSASSARTTYAGPYALGATAGGATNNLNGYIDDIGIWNRGLTNGEMAQLYASSQAGYPDAINRVSPVTWFTPSPSVVSPIEEGEDVTCSVVTYW